jgi:hypothetical protein
VIVYLTFNDQPSGVYWSQVTDVVAYMNSLGRGRVRLVALVSLHDWWGSRRRIRARLPDAIVLPMVPRLHRWRLNRWWLWALCMLLRPQAIMARGVMATWMALRMRDKRLVKRVLFDGRGAYAAEWEEYRIVEDDAVIAQFAPLEQEAVQAADMRLAVSHALVAHWRERYGYAAQQHVVIPCTLAREFEGDVPVTPEASSTERVRLVYSGSSAGWQSFELLEQLLVPLLERDPRVELLFLTRGDARIAELARRFPGRVNMRWLDHSEVRQVLGQQDAGILLREDTVTNRVSSPTKYAEYLACGLPVMMSAHIGDLSAEVEAKDLGVICRPGEALPRLEPVSPAQRLRLRQHAVAHYTKVAHRSSYLAILEQLATGPRT